MDTIVVADVFAAVVEVVVDGEVANVVVVVVAVDEVVAVVVAAVDGARASMPPSWPFRQASIGPPSRQYHRYWSGRLHILPPVVVQSCAFEPPSPSSDPSCKAPLVQSYWTNGCIQNSGVTFWELSRTTHFTPIHYCSLRSHSHPVSGR